jgi:hypothetical protein
LGVKVQHRITNSTSTRILLSHRITVATGTIIRTSSYRNCHETATMITMGRCVIKSWTVTRQAWAASVWGCHTYVTSIYHVIHDLRFYVYHGSSDVYRVFGSKRCVFSPHQRVLAPLPQVQAVFPDSWIALCLKFFLSRHQCVANR